MPLYNQNRRELTMALMSLATQIYMDWKLVIVIDGANDQTVQTLYDIMAKNEIIREKITKVVYRSKNKGIANTVNEGMEEVKDCDYITWVSSDNLYYPQFLFVLSEALDNNPDCSIVYSNFDIFEHNRGKEVFMYNSPKHLSRANRLDYIGGNTDDGIETTAYKGFIGMTFMYRKTNERYNPTYELVEDYEFFSRVMAEGNVGYVDEMLGAYRFGGSEAYTTKFGRRIREKHFIAMKEIIKRFESGIYDGRVSKVVQTNRTLTAEQREKKVDWQNFKPKLDAKLRETWFVPLNYED